jgi:probable phosphoglycerate mutase
LIRLFLVRHGNTFEAGQIPVQVGARTDLPLTEQGRNQAERFSDYLIQSGVAPKAIYAGGLKRQTQSAKIIGNRLGLEILDAPALTEIDYGPWEGLTADEITTRWPKEHAEWAEWKWQKFFGGTLEGHQSALDRWFAELRAKGEDVVIGVTSNGLLRFFRNEKVKTGHFCELHLFMDGFEIEHWNIDPKYGQKKLA